MLNASTHRSVGFGSLGALALLLTALTAAAIGRAGHAPLNDSVGALAAETFLDLEYGRVGDESLRLDLYLPEGQGPFPLIVWLHGGGWASGDKDLNPNSPQLRQINRGYAVASINYRLSHQAKFPAQIEDCKGAVRWLREHADQYKLDPDRIAAWGASAGGHLAALLGTSGDVRALEGGLNPGHSGRLTAVVDWFGPTDLLKMSADSLPFPCNLIDHDSPFSPESLLIGCAIQTCPEKTESANPIRYVSADDPPCLIMHGTRDCLVGPAQSQRLTDALAAAGVSVTLKFIEQAGHGGSQFDDDENRKLVEDFLDQTLSARPRLLKITGASVIGKKLFVFGEDFDVGAVILLDGLKQRTVNDDHNPTTVLVGRKAGKKIASGQTVILQVRKTDDSLSAPMSFTRP